ncbi:sugar ABC transporter ATP-binding protein [Nonomuraea sp. NPDC048916]|uniref:sugar ABC transporter ATP-binding protein n=1 Tax=Nonomuraea sp. NPDC048916 TaxID=3154232 RepID=UPI0033C2EA08
MSVDAVEGDGGGGRAPGELRPILEIRNLAKHFGGVRALNGVDLTVNSGEIHGLLGQNGSGKSTLIKVLAGFHPPEPGAQLRINERDVSLPLAAGDFRALGMRFVHQDLGLINSLSVLENLLIEDLSTTGHWAISWRQKRRAARELFEKYGVRIDPDSTVDDLRPVERAMLAIVRAVSSMMDADHSRSGGLLVLDEPTVFLPRDDTELLFSLTRKVAATGAGVLFVSHDLDEVKALTDRVTVFRDGAVVGTGRTQDLGHDDLVQMIVGHQVSSVRHPSLEEIKRSAVVAQVTDVSGQQVKNASLTVHAGETLGITGLSGSGFEDLLYLLFGLSPSARGTLTIEDVTYEIANLDPARALRAGLALVPADRKRDGAVLSLSVLDNVSMQVLDDYQSGPILRRRALARESRRVLDRFDVRPADPTLTASSLSGGNQQKVVMAKWLQTRPRVLLVHEPTQGVDVGAREEIYAVLRQAAQDGMAVLCASSDHEQLSLICDRVLIFRQGAIIAQVAGADVTKERISELCYGQSDVVERT